MSNSWVIGDPLASIEDLKTDAAGRFDWAT